VAPQPADRKRVRRASSPPLPRGPHSLSREEVAESQRGRLMSAMVDLVGERGYAAISVSDLTARAGVSRKAFYEQFANKQDCFLATYDSIVAEGFERVGDAARQTAVLEDELDFGLNALFQRAVDSPSVERLVLLEVSALGPVGIARREELVGSYEEMLRVQLGATPRPGIVPNPLLRAVVGGFIKVIQSHIARGAHRQLPALVPDLVRWSFSYYPLPESVDAVRELRPLAGSSLGGGRAPGTLAPGSTSQRRRADGRRTPSVSRSFVVHSQRERILDAIAQLSLENGYASLTVEDVANRASVSLQAFYEHFASKEDAFLVAYEAGHGKGLALVERAHDSAPDWPSAVRGGVAALLEFLSSEPAFAHVALVDALIATPRTADRASKGILRYAQLLAPGFDEHQEEPRPPAVAIEAIAGGIFELCLAYAVQGHVERLTELAPWVTYFALAPFVGRERAAGVATEGSA
jgi:AcrR family transcriptional regulator